jgi:hypothetical protein
VIATAIRKLSQAELWHEHFGHLSYDTMAQMVRDGAVMGLNVSEKVLCEGSVEVSDTCANAKQSRICSRSHVQESPWSVCLRI